MSEHENMFKNVQGTGVARGQMTVADKSVRGRLRVTRVLPFDRHGRARAHKHMHVFFATTPAAFVPAVVGVLVLLAVAGGNARGVGVLLSPGCFSVSGTGTLYSFQTAWRCRREF